jgi:hypothetical protein
VKQSLRKIGKTSFRDFPGYHLRLSEAPENLESIVDSECKNSKQILEKCQGQCSYLAVLVKNIHLKNHTAQ